MAVTPLHTAARDVQNKRENVFPTTHENRRKTYWFTQQYVLSVYDSPHVPGTRDEVNPGVYNLEPL